MYYLNREIKGADRDSFTVCTPVDAALPVSYTHLDVYKRQGVPRSGMGEVGGTVPLHGCAGDDLETEETALPYGGHG